MTDKKHLVFKDHFYSSEEIVIKLLKGLYENVDLTTQLLEFWNLFQKNSLDEALTSDIHKLLCCMFKALLVFPDNTIKQIAQSFLESISLTFLTDEGLPQYLQYTSFSQIMVAFAFQSLENCDLRSTQGFFHWIFQRIVTTSIEHLEKNKTEQLDSHIDVIFYSQENVEFAIKQELRYRKGFHPFYFEEIIVINQEYLDQCKKKPNCNINYQLLDLDQIFPAGLSAESVLCQIQNNNYKTLDHYDNFFSNTYKSAQKRKLTATIPTTLLSSMSIAFNSPAIGCYPILSSSLAINKKQIVGREFQFYRLNPYFIRPIQWAQHQNVESRNIYYNVKSDFFTEDDFGINQIAKLQKRWEKKAVQAKKQLLSSQLQGQDLTAQNRSSNIEKRPPKDTVKLARTLISDLLQNVVYLMDEERIREAVEFLQILNSSLGNSYIPPFSSYISKFCSKFNQLPQDSMQPFYDDVIDYANTPPLQILLISKPRSGRTTFAKTLAKKLDLEHIDLERPINRIFEKVKDNEENPKTDEEGNPVDPFTPLEKSVLEGLKQGSEISPLALLQLLNLEFTYFDQPKNKGYILDLPLEVAEGGVSWAQAILSGKLQLPKIQCRYFTHVVHLIQPLQTLRMFSKGIMEKGEDLSITSQSQRDELKRPKPKIIDPDDPDAEVIEEDEEKPQPLNEKDLFFRPTEDPDLIDKSLEVWESLKPNLLELYSHMIEKNIIRVQMGGLSADELVDVAASQLNIQRPLAIKLEGGSEKELLGINLEEQKVFRQWSQWQQIDPVELYQKEKAIQGKVEFACDYAGRVFLFDNEENQNRFLMNPRKFLMQPPVLPKSYNVAVIGPRKSGKKSIARLLEKKYGWQTIDVEDIVRQKILKQKSYEKHIPSTFDTRINDIHLTENEWKEFYKGAVIQTKDILPMVLNQMGMQMQKKPQGWGEPKKEDDDEEQKLQELEQQKKDLKKGLQKKKKEEEAKEEITEEQVKPPTPPPEDIPTKDIIPLLDAEGKIAKQPKGFLLINYPFTQEHIDLMNLFQFKLDKIIILADKSEENPGQVLLSRPGFAEYYSAEQELQWTTQVTTLLKEAYNEENVKEIAIDGTVEDNWVRVQTELDPFYIRTDDENFVRGPGDVQEGDDPLPLGDYAQYCPVTYRKSGWLVPGKEDIFAIVNGKIYKFFSEKEQKEFKDNVEKYIGQKVVAMEPRIFFVGVRGSGLKTQLAILNEQYKLPLLNLKDNFIQNLEVHKKNRQQERYFMKGFKAPELDEEGKEVPDPEIMEEPGDFDKKVHEIEVLDQMLKGCDGLFINGNFFDIGEEIVQTSLVELLQEARKLPEAVIFLKVDAKTFLERNFDTKIIQQEWEEKMSELKKRRQQERIDAREKAIQDGVPEEELPSLEPPGDEEEDPEAPKLEEMINEKKEKLLQQHEADTAKVEELFQQFTEELKIPAFQINGEATRQIVTDRIATALHPFLDIEFRTNLFEKNLTYKLNPYPDPENFTINRLVVYENSYNYRKSRFGDRNPLTLSNVPHIRDYPLLYRNRIYYFNCEEERNKVANMPLKYLCKPSIPNDVHIRPVVFVIGKIKSGKTTIAKLLSEKLKLVRIKVSNLLEDFIKYKLDPMSVKAKSLLNSGGIVDDDTIIQLLMKRTQLSDCYQYGWVLDGYPQNREQAVALTKNGIIPSAVFAMETDVKTIKERVLKKNQKFGGIDMILQQRFNKSNQEFPLLLHYYNVQFHNVRCLSTTISNWGLITLCENFIHEQLISRAQIAKSLVTKDPVNVSKLTMTENQILEKLGLSQNYCPVALKSQRTFHPSSLRSPHLVYFYDQLYLLSSEEAEKDFIENPINYVVVNIEKFQKPYLSPTGLQEKGTILEFKGNCPVALSQGNLSLGLSHLLIKYKNKWFSFASCKNLKEFERNPKQFKRVQLPDKIVLATEKNKNIAKKVAKRGDCTSYLELHLRNIIIKVLAQLGYKRMKYPTLSCKETVLKFIAISLKANNPNKDANYRLKYQNKLNEFLRHCQYPQEIKELARRKMVHFKVIQTEDASEKQDWNEWDQENLLKITEQFNQFFTELNQTDKQKYFQKFIR